MSPTKITAFPDLYIHHSWCGRRRELKIWSLSVVSKQTPTSTRCKVSQGNGSKKKLCCKRECVKKKMKGGEAKTLIMKEKIYREGLLGLGEAGMWMIGGHTKLID